DLLIVAQDPEAAAGDTLLKLCVKRAVFQGSEVTLEAASLPEEVVRAASVAMQKVDQQAHVEVALQCPACPNQWSQPFDIAAYLWSEIDDWAQRLLLEIHVL